MIAAPFLTALITLVNFVALLELVRALLGGKAGAGQSLLLDVINIWFANFIAFALWFWNIDEGGQAKLGLGLRESPDFQFPQYVLPKIVDGEWIPGFIDYVFVSSNGRDAPITSG